MSQERTAQPAAITETWHVYRKTSPIVAAIVILVGVLNMACSAGDQPLSRDDLQIAVDECADISARTNSGMGDERSTAASEDAVMRCVEGRLPRAVCRRHELASDYVRALCGFGGGKAYF